MDAPDKQLLISETNISEAIDKIYVKRSDIKDPNIIQNLKRLFERAQEKGSPKRLLKLFEARKQLLEQAGEIYAEIGEDKLFDDSVIESEIITALLKEYTLPK